MQTILEQNKKRSGEFMVKETGILYYEKKFEIKMVKICVLTFFKQLVKLIINFL